MISRRKGKVFFHTPHKVWYFFFNFAVSYNKKPAQAFNKNPMYIPLRHISFFILLALCFCSAPGLYAQAQKVQNKPFIDERKFHYGFFVGMHDQGLRLHNNGYIDAATGRQWLVEVDRPAIGLSVGVLGEWKLNKYFSLRLLPSLHFGSKNLKFRDTGTGDTQSEEMKSTYIGLPLNLKMSGPRVNNYRPYVVVGVNPLYDLTAKKGKRIRTKPFNCALEVGLGCDAYLRYFKLIPELKFSFGLANVLKKDRSDLRDPNLLVFTQGVDKATSNMVTLCFYFE